MGLKTDKHYSTIPNRQNGRSVKLTAKNVYQVIDWIGSNVELFWTKSTTKNPEQQPSLKIKTAKGLRRVNVGDTIIKFGTWRNGKTPSFEVVKAS